MPKRILILLACFFMVGVTQSYGQQQRYEIGLSAGYTRNTLTTDNGSRSFTRNYPLNGFQVAIPMQYHINDWFGVQLDLAYVQKNYALRRTGFFEGVENEVTNSFIQAPLMAHFSFGGEDLRGFLNLGGFAGYWASSRIRGASGDAFSADNDLGDNDQLYRFSEIFNLSSYDERVSFDSRRDRRLELGLLAGVGLEYRVSPQYKIFAEARYQYSLTDLQKNYMINQIPRYNNTFGVQLGVLYGFGGR
ncbi:porin family protein [Sphingobacterium corticibacter]|uniref:PorT family protein n=1 Tax=Sphingobacterium corticibacter TaxID=2171749 RepID=A0A2T8HGM2_9SPHI|nr:porin family protein [Sphingobacterium corticibacter]PVH24596.1 PorT family protein [Sphingobacterium corticibacter]